MRRPFAAALLLVLGGAASADTPATTQWVLATAKATGAGGEQFVSSLRISNPFPQVATVDLTYLAQSQIDPTGAATGDNAAAPKVRVTVGPGETLAVEDVLGTTFAGKAAPFGISAGGLRVDSDVPVSVLSRTYVANARSAAGVPGTFGFSIPAQVEAQALSAGETGWLTFVSGSPSSASGFRTNLILLNTGATPALLRVALRRGDGSVAGERDYTLGRFSAAQQGNLGAAFGLATSETNLRATVTVTSGGPVAIGASLIDNAISSIAYLPPVKVDAPDDGAYGWVATRGDPALASAGRLDVVGGAPNFLSGLLVVECPAGSFLYTVLAYGAGAGVPDPNTTFAPRAEGGFSFTGSAADAGSWSGTVSPRFDGTLLGTLTFSPPATSRCAGTTKSFDFAGSRAAALEAAP
ncbi:MAG TPA: hypothetical protein PLL76_17125 [Thermoanaerobaculia bacterium]|nr:hypothetical protein [Thermoanaerobaculia bacterium]